MKVQTMEVGLRLTAIDRMSAVINQATRRANQRFKWMESGINGFKSFSNKIFMAGGVMAAGIYQTVKAAEDAETANKKLENTMNQMWHGNGAAMQAAKRMEKFAEVYQLQIGVSKDEIKDVQSILVTYAHLSDSKGIKGGLFERSTKAAFDMASVFGDDPKAIANRIGKALEDPLKMAKSLQRTGTIMPSDIPLIQKAAVTKGRYAAQLAEMKAIERQFKGTAEKSAKATNKIRVGFLEVSETLGKVFLPYFLRASQVMVPYVLQAKQFIDTHKGMILGLTKAGIKILGVTLALRGILFIVEPVIKMFKMFTILKTVAVWLKTTSAMQWLLNTSFLGCPIIWIIAGVAALAAGVIYCWNKFAGFRAVVKTVGVTLKNFGLLIWNYVTARVMGLIKGMQTLGRVITDIFGGNFKNALNDAKSGIDGILGISATKNLIVGVKGTVQGISGTYKTIYSKEKEKQYPHAAHHSTVVNYSPNVTINGNANKEDFSKMLTKHKNDIVNIMQKHQANQQRLSYQ